MKGRKPTPTALKKLRSTERPCRVNDQEAQPATIEKLPPAPRWFSKMAKKIYRTKGQELINMNIMGTLDLDMFTLYCNEFATYIETSEQIAQIPLNAALGESSTEIYKRIRQQNQQAWERCKNIAIEFGFTPSARSRVNTIQNKEELSDFEKLMRG